MRLVLLTCLVAGCSSPAPLPASHDLVVARPYDDPNVPPSYHGQPTPLIVMLHGFSATAYVEEAAIYQLTDVSNDKGFIYATPQGTRDSMMHPFWNATDACCDEENTGVDDVAYLNAVIDDLEWKYNIDKKRVFVTGHSNGGFMSHRLACDSASRLAAIVSLAGVVWLDPSKCNPSEPLAVLQVHGDADPTVPYNGTPVEPSAKQTVATWAQKNGCTGTTLDPAGTTMDLVINPPGPETRIEAYGGCPANSAAELWTMMGVGHVPPFYHPAWGDAIVDWMFAHPKP